MDIENLGKFFGQNNFLKTCSVAVFNENFPMKHLFSLRLNSRRRPAWQPNEVQGKCFVFVASSENWQSADESLKYLIDYFQVYPIFAIKLYKDDDVKSNLIIDEGMLFPIIHVKENKVG